MEVKELVEQIARSLVDEPDQVSVTEKEEESTTLLMLQVANDDLGKVIGKRGNTARAIRTILNATGKKLNKPFRLEILE